MEMESSGSLMPSNVSMSASKDAQNILVVLKSEAVDVTQNDYLCVFYIYFSKLYIIWKFFPRYFVVPFSLFIYITCHF